jgi:hypothetical protein
MTYTAVYEAGMPKTGQRRVSAAEMRQDERDDYTLEEGIRNCTPDAALTVATSRSTRSQTVPPGFAW